MSRRLKIAAAQLGPLHRSDSRSAATRRLVELLREAHAMGAKFVVFPELALTTFLPRWWVEDAAEAERRYFARQIPGRQTPASTHDARRLGAGFSIRYARPTPAY